MGSRTQNPVVRKHRVGSSPTSGTRKIPANRAFLAQIEVSPGSASEGFGSSRLRKGLFHRRRLVTHVRQDVRVSVEGYCMSKHFGNNLRVHVAGEQQRGARMPEVVEADLRQPGPLL